MQSIIGNVRVVEVGSSSVLMFGDTIQIFPRSLSKSFAGAGSFITGDFVISNNAVSATNTKDVDVSDSDTNTIGNSGVK